MVDGAGSGSVTAKYAVSIYYGDAIARSVFG